MSGAATNALRTYVGQRTLVGTDGDFLFPVYLALFTTDPGDAGDPSGEVTASEYSRQLIGFASPETGVFTWVSNIDVIYEAAASSWGSVGWAGIMDGTGPGASMIYHGVLAAGNLPTGYQVKLPAGAGQVTFP